MLYSIALILIICLLIYKYLVWNFDYWKIRGVPGPKPKPFFGSFVGSTLQKTMVLYEFNDIYKKYRGKSNFIGIFQNRTPQIMVIEPEFVKDVLIKHFKNFHDNEFADMVDKEKEIILSQNPFMLTGEMWKEKRSEITPAFTANRIRAMYPIMEDVNKKLTIFINNENKKSSSKDGIDTKELAAKYTTDVVSNCIYGLDSKSFTDDKSIIRQMGIDLFNPNPWVFAYFVATQILPFLGRIYQMKLVPRRVEIFFQNIVKDAIALREQTKSSIERDDFLNYVLDLKKRKNLNDLNVAAHTVTFFLDGMETSSIVIAYILYELGCNPDIQKRLREEIQQQISESKNGNISYEQLIEMAYLDQIFNETLRMHPPAISISRKCTESITCDIYKEKQMTIEKGTIIVIPVYSMHMDPEYYENPTKFNPERFDEKLGGTKQYRDKGVFLPFGDGPRICLGMRFGVTQTKSAIVEIVRNFTISVNPKMKQPIIADPQHFMLMPIGGFWLDFKAL